MWSTPVERVGPDGSRYSLVLLDTEGIDAYDQVGAHVPLLLPCFGCLVWAHGLLCSEEHGR